jgi:hypothetical protein
MTSGKGLTYADVVLSLLLRGVVPSAPARWLALYSDAGAVLEVAAGDYTRLSVASAFGAPSGGVTTNSTAIEWPATLSAWGTVASVAVLDAATGGSIIYYGALASPVSVALGTVPRFPPGTLTVQEE